MRKIFLILALSVSVLISACSDDVVFDQKNNFSSSTWMRFEAEDFDVKINNTEDCYDIYFSVVVDTNVLKLKNIPLVVNITDSEGGRRTFMTEVPFNNKKGQFEGKPIGDFVEITAKAREYFYFNSKGIHKFSIKNSTQFYELKGIASIGMKIEKSNMDINIE